MNVAELDITLGNALEGPAATEIATAATEGNALEAGEFYDLYLYKLKLISFPVNCSSILRPQTCFD